MIPRPQQQFDSPAGENFKNDVPGWHPPVNRPGPLALLFGEKAETSERASMATVMGKRKDKKKKPLGLTTPTNI